MEPRPKSGLALPNRLARTTLLVLQSMLATNELQALLEAAHLPHLIDTYPLANLARGFDFADYAAINQSLEDMYGGRGSRSLALRAGRTIFAELMNDFGPLVGNSAAAFRLLPLTMKLNLALPAMARIYNEISDQNTQVEKHPHAFHYLIEHNPVCWGRSGENGPVCFLQVGILQEALHRISGGHEFRVDEAECLAAGAKACRFILMKEPLN